MAGQPYICVIDDTGKEVEGSRRYVDFRADRATYFAALTELEAAMGEGCSIFDSETDIARED